MLTTRHIYGLAWAGVVGCLCLCLGFSGCLPARAVFLAAPDHKDSNRFRKAVVEAGAETLQFTESTTDWGKLLKVTDWTTDVPVFSTLHTIASQHQTQALLVIRNDTILSQYYAPGNDSATLFPSYSLAKSFLSALVGMAVQQGYVQHVDELVKNYLPQLDFHPYFNQLTIRHLLNHTSGIKYSLALDGTIYYGNNLTKGIRKIKFDTLPGTQQRYININSQLLGLLLEKATGQSAPQYLQQQLWQPLGMQHDAFWSTDKKGQAKTYCCLNATATDLARFGRLYMHRGQWEGRQLLDESWIEQSLAADTTQGSSYAYNYSWYLGLAGYNDFMAIGYLKQYIYIHPDKNLIIVLLNRKEDKLLAERVNWPYIFRQVADQL